MDMFLPSYNVPTSKYTCTPVPYTCCTAVLSSIIYQRASPCGTFAGGLYGRRSPARVMPKMLAALWRRIEIRRNAKS